MRNRVRNTPNRRHYGATISERGQVTIPAAVRRLLGLGPRDRVRFEVEDGTVMLLPEPFTIETAFGAVEPINRPEDFEALLEIAMDEHAEHVLREMDH
jgi:antitoxin PrlF